MYSIMYSYNIIEKKNNREKAVKETYNEEYKEIQLYFVRAGISLKISNPKYD